MKVNRKRKKRYKKKKMFCLCILVFGMGVLSAGEKIKTGHEKGKVPNEEIVIETNASIKSEMIEQEEQEEREKEKGYGNYQTKEDMKSEEWERLPEKLKELYDKNPETRGFVVNYWENKDKEFPIDLKEYQDSAEVPLLLQWDKRWGYEEYSGNVFGLTGCGPTCLSMVAIYLKQDVTMTPKWMMDFSIRNGYSVSGHGSAWALIGEGSTKLGLKAEELPLMESIMKEKLRNGGLIIAVLGPGDFTDNGHFIVVTGYDEEGFMIKDPNSVRNSNKKWTYEELKVQIRNLWSMEKR